MKFLATSALLLTLILPAAAQDYRISPDVPALARPQQALIAGIGRMSCAHWLSESFNEGEGWILGFWSGLNLANARTVGQQSDGGVIIAEVRKVCATRPSMALVNATFTAYSEMASRQVRQNLPPPVMPEDSKVDTDREIPVRP
jgi:hypothetical protein